METKQKVLIVMAKTFSLEINDIPGDVSPHKIKAWSSLSHIKLLKALEKEFKIKFDDDEIAELINLEIICNAIESHQ